jgi:ABC-type phosphate transport system auxiliary subunit
MTKRCPRCQNIRNNEDFLSFKLTRIVKCCLHCRQVSKAYNEKVSSIKPNREKLYKKKTKQINEELNDTAYKLSQVKKLEKEYRSKMDELHREYADFLLDNLYLTIGDFA